MIYFHVVMICQILFLLAPMLRTRAKIIPRALLPRLLPTLKLPVWPVYGGVFAQLSDWLGGKFTVTDKLLDGIGGRVVPMTLADSGLSPFLLLVHHCNSFLPFDPVRSITRLLLPEGFPAHPHSGFSTVTYCIDGGLRHRDSEGNKMAYGNGDVQWMTAGRGTIHEEMWDIEEAKLGLQKIEIFQLWVNLPIRAKDVAPAVTRLRNEDIPVLQSSTGVSCKVIAGVVTERRLQLLNSDSYSSSSDENVCDLIFRYGSMTVEENNQSVDISGVGSDNLVSGPGGALSASPIGLLHVNLPANGVLRLTVPSGSTAAVYLRRGSLLAGPSTPGELPGQSTTSDAVSSCNLLLFDANTMASRIEQDNSGGRVSRPSGSRDDELTSTQADDEQTDEIQLHAGESGLDALLLFGQPLKEPVLMRGPLVQATEEALSRSAQVFNAIGAGAYWEYTLPDADWLKHCQKSLQRLMSQFYK